MSTFYPRATPPHRSTALRISCDQEAGSTGRYRLTAHEGEHWVASNLFAWNVWLGHNCGQLLVDDFIQYAEARAPLEAAERAQIAAISA